MKRKWCYPMHTIIGQFNAFPSKSVSASALGNTGGGLRLALRIRIGMGDPAVSLVGDGDGVLETGGVRGGVVVIVLGRMKFGGGGGGEVLLEGNLIFTGDDKLGGRVVMMFSGGVDGGGCSTFGLLEGSKLSVIWIRLGFPMGWRYCRSRMIEASIVALMVGLCTCTMVVMEDDDDEEEVSISDLG